jgi:hypothetical protein
LWANRRLQQSTRSEECNKIFKASGAQTRLSRFVYARKGRIEHLWQRRQGQTMWNDAVGYASTLGIGAEPLRLGLLIGWPFPLDSNGSM